MLELSRYAYKIANVVQLNPTPDALGFTAAFLSKGNRLIRICEVGTDQLTVDITLPSLSAMQVRLPNAQVFPKNVHALKEIFYGLKSVKILLIQQEVASNTLNAIITYLKPDAICVGKGVTVINLITNLAIVRPDLDLSSIGLLGLCIFANQSALDTLNLAFTILDAQQRQRRRQREVVYGVDDLVICSGIYPVEQDMEWRWAWTGPETIATFLAPMHGGASARITLFFFAGQQPVHPDNIHVVINGKDYFAGYYEEEMKIVVDVLGLPHEPFARFDLFQRRMMPTEDQSRRLGYALHKLKIEVEP